MIRNTRFLPAGVFVLCIACFTSCHYVEDPGFLQEEERRFSLVDFDRLEMGNAFVITVEQATFFNISARGDRRNLDDLIAEKEGNTLVIRYWNTRNRKHLTYITITMPTLRAVNFSGASNSMVTGFSDQEEFDGYLSGASTLQLSLEATTAVLSVSGASTLNVSGSTQTLQIQISGASHFNGFNFLSEEVDFVASGASVGKVFAENELDVTASGASVVYYMGDPVVTSQVSGSSTVQKY